jgi:cellulose synthase (UDP-forming)
VPFLKRRPAAGGTGVTESAQLRSLREAIALEEHGRCDEPVISSAMPDSSEQNSVAPHRRVERERVFKYWDYPVFAILFLVNLAAVKVFLSAWLVSGRWGGITPGFIALTALIVYNLAISLFRWALLPLMTRPKPMPPTFCPRIAAVTTIVPGAESLEMLERTVQAMVAMRMSHDTWVLDEGDHPDVKALCARTGAKHFSRKGRADYNTPSGTFAARTKHGNYNAWLDAEGYAHYDVIVGFDPDHVPYADFLEASVGFLEDPAIGYVQQPQIYYNQSASLVARGAAEETYSYYSATQMASYTFGFPIVTGCHQVHRTTALKEVGGFAAHDADDLLIALLYRSAGWQGVYLPEVHAKGLTPTDWASYLKQQLRWASSVIDVKLRAYPRIAAGMPLPTRFMSLLHGFYYIQEGITGLFMTVFLVYSITLGHTPGFLEAGGAYQLLATIPVFLVTDFYKQRFFLERNREWGVHWRAGFLRFVKWPYLLFGLIDGVTGKKRPYSITSKVKNTKPKVDVMWPHAVTLGLLIAATAVAVLRDTMPHIAILVAAGLTAGSALLALIAERAEAPDPYDDALLLREVPEVFRHAAALPAPAAHTLRHSNAPELPGSA